MASIMALVEMARDHVKVDAQLSTHQRQHDEKTDQDCQQQRATHGDEVNRALNPSQWESCISVARFQLERACLNLILSAAPNTTGNRS